MQLVLQWMIICWDRDVYQLHVPCTSAGLFHMDKLVCEAHDIRILFLAHISQEMEQRLLQVSRFGVTQLIGKEIDLKREH